MASLMGKIKGDVRMVPPVEALHEMCHGEVVDVLVNTRMEWLAAEKRFLKIQAEQSATIARQRALLDMHERYLAIEAKRVGACFKDEG